MLIHFHDRNNKIVFFFFLNVWREVNRGVALPSVAYVLFILFFKTLSSRQKKREPFGFSAVTMVTKNSEISYNVKPSADDGLVSTMCDMKFWWQLFRPVFLSSSCLFTPLLSEVFLNLNVLIHTRQSVYTKWWFRSHHASCLNVLLSQKGSTPYPGQ